MERDFCGKRQRSGRLGGLSGVAAAAAILGLLVLGASGASASSIVSFQLTAGNTALSPYAGPYATVTVDLTSSTQATITFSGNSVGGNTYLFGDSSSAAVNVNATSWTIGSFAASNAGTGFAITAADLSDSGSKNVDSFGVFNQTVQDFDGFMHSADTLQFTLTNTGGMWADASSVLAPNALGNLAAAHIFVCSGSGTCSEAAGALTTGYASQVPEPASLALLVLGGVALASRRSRIR